MEKIKKRREEKRERGYTRLVHAEALGMFSLEQGEEGQTRKLREKKRKEEEKDTKNVIQGDAVWFTSQWSSKQKKRRPLTSREKGKKDRMRKEGRERRRDVLHEFVKSVFRCCSAREKEG